MVEMTTRLSEIFMAEATSLMRELDRVMGLRDLALKSLSPFGKRLKDFFGRKTMKAYINPPLRNELIYRFVSKSTEHQVSAGDCRKIARP